MATDVNKLVVQVLTKNVKETKKELDDLKKTVKDLVEQLKNKRKEEEQGTNSQNKFTTATTSFRNELPNVASGLYLIKQAYGLLSSAMSDVEEAYEAQFSSEIKLEAILKTTGNAIGYTTEEIYKMTDAWASMTGINDSVLNEAAAIGATFVDISKEVFPDLIKQALNMSTIFNQDLKQSIIQLGVATNNLQVSRLTRIGISFTDQQKDQIRVLRESGQVLEAQQVIMAELEREIGGVAEAMGQSTIGKIKAFGSAWTDVKEEIGGTTLNLKAEILDITGLTGVLDVLKDSLHDINTEKAIEDLFDTTTGSNSLKLQVFSAEELSNAYEDVITNLNIARYNKKQLDEQLLKLPGAQQRADNLVKYYEDLAVAIVNAQTLKTNTEASEKERIAAEAEIKRQLQIAAGIKEKTDREKEFRDLADKARLAGIDDKYEKEREALRLFWEDIKAKAKEAKVSDEELIKLSGDYFNVTMAQINKSEQAFKDLTEAKKQEALINGVLENSNLSMIDAQSILEELYLKDKIGVEAYTRALMDLANAQEVPDAPDKETITSWDGLFDAFIDGTIDAIDWTKSLDMQLKNVAKTALGIGVSGVSDVFANIGESLRGSNEGALTFEQSMLKIVDSTLEAIGPQLMLAGAMALANPLTGGILNPVAWALIAAGGGASFLGGLIDSSGSSSSTDNSVNYSDGYTGDVLDPTNSLPIDTSRGLTPSTVIINDYSTGTEVKTSQGADGATVFELFSKGMNSNYNMTKKTIPVG